MDFWRFLWLSSIYVVFVLLLPLLFLLSFQSLRTGLLE